MIYSLKMLESVRFALGILGPPIGAILIKYGLVK